MRSCSHRRHDHVIGLVLPFLLLLVLGACGGDEAVSPGASSVSASAAASGTPSSRAQAAVELGGTLGSLRSALHVAYERGRSGKPFQTNPSISAALTRYFRVVDPGEFNGASRARLVYAYPVAEVPGGERSTARRQYVIVYFWADGAQMVVAGDMAPGLNEEFLRLSRSSAAAAWHVDGLCYP